MVEPTAFNPSQDVYAGLSCELLVEILCYLTESPRLITSEKDLHRMLRVCRTWNEIINQYFFTKQQRLHFFQWHDLEIKRIISDFGAHIPQLEANLKNIYASRNKLTMSLWPLVGMALTPTLFLCLAFYLIYNMFAPVNDIPTELRESYLRIKAENWSSELAYTSILCVFLIAISIYMFKNSGVIYFNRVRDNYRNYLLHEQLAETPILQNVIKWYEKHREFFSKFLGEKISIIFRRGNPQHALSIREAILAHERASHLYENLNILYQLLLSTNKEVEKASQILPSDKRKIRIASMSNIPGSHQFLFWNDTKYANKFALKTSPLLLQKINNSVDKECDTGKVLYRHSSN